jgi:hypothetical protein
MPVGTMENHETNSFMIASQAVIWTRDLPNTLNLTTACLFYKITEIKMHIKIFILIWSFGF